MITAQDAKMKAEHNFSVKTAEQFGKDVVAIEKAILVAVTNGNLSIDIEIENVQDHRYADELEKMLHSKGYTARKYYVDDMQNTSQYFTGRPNRPITKTKLYIDWFAPPPVHEKKKPWWMV